MHKSSIGGHGVCQTPSTAAHPPRLAAAPTHQSASQPARKLLNLAGVAAKFGLGERTAHGITLETWFPPAIVLGPRIRRWDEAEIDAAVAARAPRRTEMTEPDQLLRARVERLKGRAPT